MALFYAGQRILSAYLNNISLVATQTLTLPTATVTFGGIPAYNHLSLKWHARGDNAVTAEQLNMQVNGVSGANYVTEKLEAVTASSTATQAAGSTSAQIGTIPGSSASALYFGAGLLEIPGIADLTNDVPFVGMGTALPSNSAGYVGLYAGMLAGGTRPITTLTLFPASGNFIAGTQFSLYGWM